MAAKKGWIQHALLISAIGIIVTLSILILLLVRLGIILDADTDMRLCQTTLEMQTITQIGPDGYAFQVNSPLKLNCKRRFIEITDAKIVQKQLSKLRPDEKLPVYLKNNEGKLEKTTDIAGKPRDEVLDSFMAESMKRCWAQGFEGKQKLFNDPTFYDKVNICLICDQINVNVEPAYAKRSLLSSYLIDTTMPNRKDPVTYADYLFTLTQGEEDDETLSGGKICLVDNSIDETLVGMRSGTYATVFIRGGASAHNDGCMAAYVVPATRLTGLCDYVAN